MKFAKLFSVAVLALGITFGMQSVSHAQLVDDEPIIDGLISLDLDFPELGSTGNTRPSRGNPQGGNSCKTGCDHVNDQGCKDKVEKACKTSGGGRCGGRIWIGYRTNPFTVVKKCKCVEPDGSSRSRKCIWQDVVAARVSAER